MEAIKAKGIKPSVLEKDLGFSNGYLATMDKRSGNLGEDALIKLAKYLNFSLNYLISGENENSGIQLVHEPSMNYQNEGKLMVYTAHGSITEAYNDEIPLEDRTYVSITGYTGANYRAFKIIGNSMEPLAAERDIVVGKCITDPREIRNGHVYVIAHKTDGVMCKRLYIHRKGKKFEIECLSDNELYEPRNYYASEILEFWHVKTVLKFNLTKAVPDFLQLKKLQKEILELSNRVESK